MEKGMKTSHFLLIGLLLCYGCTDQDEANGKVFDEKVVEMQNTREGGEADASDPVVVTSRRSTEAEQLLTYLKNIEGEKTLSGAMATVNWNTNEAEWVHRHTGRWPAINCFDYIHHVFSSKGGWIDYSNITVVENWHRNGGIVAAMWHWNVPANNGKDYSFYYGDKESDTKFDVRKIFDESSAEYQRMIKDIDQVAGYLKLLQQKGIPVLWRPLHEAGGMWFWWGRDPEACNELWRVMYRRFQAAGLNNLIWVWTQSSAWGKPYSDGYRWYPGDEYVDIVGMDVYNTTDVRKVANDCYNFLREYSPDKLVALTECGGVPTMGRQWRAGAKWLFVMPWYDYSRTNNPNSTAFAETSHSCCDITWWENTWSEDFVLSRDQIDMEAAGIHELRVGE